MNKSATPNGGKATAGAEADLLLTRHVRGTVAHLQAAQLKRADPGLDAALGPASVPHDPLTPIRQGLLGMLRDEGVGLGVERGRKHAPGPVARDPGQRVLPRSGLVKRGDRAIFMICWITSS